MKFDKIIVSDNSFKSSDPYDLVYSNITVVNLLRSEGVEEKLIHPDSLISYYLDYYLAQNNNGGFAQFVFNSKWNEQVNSRIENGLKQIGAEKHLAFFKAQAEKVKLLPKREFTSFFKRKYADENPTRDKLKDNSFFDIDEAFTELNSKWLRNHQQLQVLTLEDMYLEIEKHLGREIER